MDIAPREKFGLGSKLKRAVRKIIPNEVASVASAAAPFVAPFNPLLAAGMAGIGSFDKSGSISGALRSGALTYGLGNLARVVGGAGFQAGLKAPGTGTGFGSYFTSPMSGQQLFGQTDAQKIGKAIQQDAAQKAAAADLDSYMGIEEYLAKTDPSKLTLGQQADIVAQQVSTGTPKTGYKDILGKIVGRDATFAERTQAIKDLGGKAIKDIYTTDEGKVDKLALAATIGGVGSYVEAKKLAEEAELVGDADEYTEEMYEADKAKYAERYGSYLTPEAFGLKEGGRVNLQGGGIPSIMLEKKDYNFMDLIDEDAEEEYYKKKAEELDRKYNPQNYNDIIPKEKPMDQYMLNEIMSERGMNTLSEEARDDAMKMYAERAYKKGQISEDEYREIMGFKVGGRVGFETGGNKKTLADYEREERIAELEDLMDKLMTEEGIQDKGYAIRLAGDLIDMKNKGIDSDRLKFLNEKSSLYALPTDMRPEPEYYDALKALQTRVYEKEGGRVGYKDGTSEMGMMDPKKIKQAEQMIGMGMDFSTISSITGLSEDTIEQLMKTEKKADGGIMGGRVGYKDAGFTTVKDLGIEREELGFPYDKSEYNLEDVDLLKEMPKVVVMDKEGKTRIVPENVAERLGLNVIMDSFDTESLMRNEKKTDGGIMGVRNKYAMGSEVPIRENQAGIREMDFRQTGGFVPPIGVKEKADDIPAMLSNNEFVFTADAVRAAGGGSVNKGAQKMYNLMKSLENKVV
jgi:hypothetical protein